MYKGVKVRYCKRENGKPKYFTKILKFENGIPEEVKGDEFDFNYKKLDKWIFSQLPEMARLMGYGLIELEQNRQPAAERLNSAK